jgi:DNA (cytosine-5)-methyltransferase 1
MSDHAPMNLTLQNEAPPRGSLHAVVSTRFRAADLYCGAGGAGMGIHRAGFDVEGWDIKQSLSYPFRRRIGDALDADLTGFDFVWASPPCQSHSALRHLYPEKEYACFIDRTRDKLKAWGGPYIIENVPGAPLLNPVQLCGSTFGLQVRRHRIFESNVPLVVPPCNHVVQGRPIDVSGNGGRRINRRPDDHGGSTNHPRNIREAQRAIGIEWMCREEIAQAIPPAFSEFLCRQVAAYLRRSQGANDQALPTPTTNSNDTPK